MYDFEFLGFRRTKYIFFRRYDVHDFIHAFQFAKESNYRETSLRSHEYRVSKAIVVFTT